MNSEPSIRPIGKPQRLFAIWSMILLLIVLPLALSFEWFMWWRGHSGWSLLGDIFLLVFLGPFMTWMFFAMAWSGILEKKLNHPITSWHCVSVILCGVLDLVLVAFVTLTTIVASRTIQNFDTRLVGYFVPGGRVFFTGLTGASSINNSHRGSLTINWLSSQGTNLSSAFYDISGGTDTKHNMVSGDTFVRHSIKLPAGSTQDLSMSWSSSGTVMTFEGNKPGNIHAGGPGVGFTVYVEHNPYTANGSLVFPDHSVYNPIVERLVMLKESNRVLLWVGAFLLLFVTVGCLLRVGILPNMFPPQQKPITAAKLMS
jgi:hypothetical protein